jgi:RNA polymerase sigma factor (sigma-70 family)
MEQQRLAELAAAARGGSVTAFCDLVLATQEPVREHIARLGARGAAVDAIAQDAYIAAWRGFARFEADRDILPWLKGIARNLVRKHFAREARRPEVAIAAGLEACAEAAAGPALPLDILRRCLDGLAGRARRIVQLHYFESRTSAEIGAAIGLEATAVRMALNRARTALQDCVHRHLARESTP